jgi:dihydrofolate reductase
MSENRIIGKGDKIPWHIKEDLIRFRDKTIDHTVIIGRKTMESLLSYYKKSGRPLPKRNHIIITRDKNYSVNLPNCYVVNSVIEAVNLAKKIEKKEIFISGGEEIFRQTISLADKLYLTIVKGNFDGDKFFPDYSEFKKIVFEENHAEGDIKFKFVELTK